MRLPRYGSNGRITLGAASALHIWTELNLLQPAYRHD